MLQTSTPSTSESVRWERHAQAAAERGVQGDMCYDPRMHRLAYQRIL